jgi:hypothetical protein
MPDDLRAQLDAVASGGDVPEPETQQQPQQTESQTLTEEAAAGAAPPAAAPPRQQQAAATQPEQPPPPAPLWREMAGKYGINIPDTASEEQVLGHLFQQRLQAQRLQTQLEALAPQMSEFNEWRKAQQAVQAPPKAAEEPYWKQYYNPPEFDPAWRQQIAKDLEGNLIPAQGAPPDIVNRYLTAQAFRDKEADRFMQNPHTYMEPTIKHVAREEAKALFNQLMAEQAQREFIQQTVTSPDMTFVYETDPQGNIRRDPFSNEPIPSQLGRVYQHYAQQGHNKGWSPQDQHEFALAKVEAVRAQMAQQTQQQTSGDRTKQKQDRAHAGHERKPNMGGMLPGPADGVTPPPTAPGLDLRDHLLHVLKDETEESIRDFRLGRAS